jgi:hypothetical protein
MKPVVEPVDKKELQKELNRERFVRNTNNGDNEIYIITHHDSPKVMREIGRLREVTFRTAGGGTGHEIDIDEFDTSDAAYKQLVVWNPAEMEIVGGYRYIKMKDAPVKDGILQVATTELFTFSPEFMNEYVPYTVELGRSFVQPKFQPAVDNRKGLFSLDNLWDGLGAIVVDNPDVKHFYGKVTMYTDYDARARAMIYAFMEYFFPDKDRLVVPIDPVKLNVDVSDFLSSIKGLSYKDAHKIMNQNIRALGEHIPPLVNAYMNLSATMKSFGTGLNSHFGDVEETGILVTIADIYESKKERHVNTYEGKKV